MYKSKLQDNMKDLQDCNSTDSHEKLIIIRLIGVRVH